MAKFDISQLKKISNSTLSTMESKTQRNNFVDDRFWSLKRDANGNGKAIIRILPSIRNGELPWVEQWSYAIKLAGGWYIETSRRTVGQPDPMAEYISERWKAAQSEADKSALRAAGLSKARHQYIANILVINDPEHPENNGKVMLWKFGQKIFDMITDMAKPDPFDESKGGVNVTDWESGCNFKLIMYTKDRFPSYDKSTFEAASSVGGDEVILSLAEKMYDLGEFTDPSKIKSYEELKARVERVTGSSSTHTSDNTGFESAPRSFAQESAPVTQTVAPTPFTAPATPAPTKSAEKMPWETDDVDFDELLKDI